ncbi:MAG: F0F1 ATP synthase subunit epsilon [Armatimonadota bacterium]|nr:F0F1 ATP synthase subunit epsilon [bacterium]
MAERKFKLEVITPDRKVLSDDSVVSVTLPGIEGYLGVLANHAPLMTALGVGELDFRKADGTADSMAIAGGFVEVYDNTVTVLADSGELREEIDVDRAEAAIHRAEERLASHAVDIDAERARVALLRAINRLKVASRRI